MLSKHLSTKLLTSIFANCKYNNNIKVAVKHLLNTMFAKCKHLINSNIIISLIIVIIYPLFWLSILYEIIRSGSSISLLNRSLSNGSIYSNYHSIYISYFILLQLFLLIIN